MQLLATLSIDLARSLAFAELSGDFNPLHCDPVAARRTMFGGSVVHGVHAMLLGLDAWCARQGAGMFSIRRLNAQFQKPIPTGVPFSVACAAEPADTFRLVLDAGGGPAQTIQFEVGPPASGGGAALPSARHSRVSARDLTFAEASQASGAVPLALDGKAFAGELPHLARAGLADLVAVVLASTRVVGMECPGLNSVFTGLAYNAGPGRDDAQLSYRVVSAAERLSTLKIAFEAPSGSGMISAVYRPPQVRQTSYADIRARVPEGAFRGRNAIVVGGSRGLGEVAAKILAAGGASLWLTYHAGRDDAAALCREIVAEGGMVSSGRLDLLSGEFDGPAFPGGGPPTHIYLFASPPITAKRSPEWSQPVFERYARTYAAQPIAMVEALAERSQAKLSELTLFVPSSVFVDSPPIALAEYAAAKAAAEIAWKAFAKVNAGLALEMPRLPRMLTDQTNALAGAPPPRPEDVLLPLLLGRAATEERISTTMGGYGR